MSGVSDKKTPAERALDLFVYGPLGFALEAKELVPKLVERGRTQVTNQTATARMIGEFAVKTGSAEAGKRLGKVQEQATAALGDLGLWPAPDSAGADTPPATAVDPVPVEPADTAPPAPEDNGAPTGPVPAADELAIPDYDGLAASQVVPRLEGLEQDELESVRLYESAHRGRKTVLGKIAQLQSA